MVFNIKPKKQNSDNKIKKEFGYKRKREMSFVGWPTQKLRLENSCWERGRI